MAPAGDLRVGESIGSGYRLVRWLADGNLGPVYEALRTADGSRTAVKILSDRSLQRAEMAARLRLECELLRRLAHPHLIQVMEVAATERGEPCLVMELLDGETLADRVARGPLLATEALRIAVRVASALSAAHRQGVVHSALRPRDVFLARVPGEPDVVKVLGFGLGRLSSEHSRVTVRMEHGAVGAYFAPEQLRPHGRADHRADQFALGAITYEMLTGKSPFSAASAADVAQRILSADPPPPSRAAANVPDAVDSVVLRALAKDPMARYANVSQLGQALENAAAAASIQSRSRRHTPSSAPEASAYSVRTAHADSRLAHARTAPAPVVDLEPERARAETQPEPLAPPSSSDGRSGRPVSEPRPVDAVTRARQLADGARHSLTAGELDGAVARAEQLFEHALTHQSDARVLEVLRTHFALLDRIFSQRLGEMERRVVAGPAAEGSSRPELSPAACALLEMARSGVTLRELLARAEMPRRDAIRVIAGLLRRRVLVAVDRPSD